MKLLLNFLFSFLLLVYCYNIGYGENKIKKTEIPQQIRSYIEKKYPEAKHIQYYKDVKDDTVYYEVELKYKKEHLSLTFLQDGSLYELEKKTAFEELPQPTQKKILDYLNSRYSRYKISSVQFVNPHLQIQFELSIKAKDKSGLKFYDIYFSETGALLHTEEIIIEPIQTLF
jgi:hypothetical protein